MTTETSRRLFVGLSLLCALSGLVPFPALAQTHKLGLAEAARMALDNLPQVEAASLRVDAATERVSAARGRYAPTTSLRVRTGLAQDEIVDQILRSNGVDTLATTEGQRTRTRSVDAVAAVQLELYDFGARRHALRSARAAVDVSRAELSSVQLAAVLEVVELYLLVLRDERRVIDAELSVSIQERQASMIARLVERKARPEVDLQRARIQLQSSRDSVDVLRAETRRDRVELALALGVRSVDDVALEPVGEGFLELDTTPSDVARSALEHRPERRMAAANVVALHELSEATGSSLAPRLGVEAQVGYTLFGQRAAADENDLYRKEGRTQASAFAVLSWTGLDPAAWATRRAQLADASAARKDARAVERELRGLALSSLEERSRASALLERAKHLREGTQAALDAQQKRYELGAASLLELLDAQFIEQQARAQLIDAELAEALAEVRLLARCGLLTERALSPRI